MTWKTSIRSFIRSHKAASALMIVVAGVALYAYGATRPAAPAVYMVSAATRGELVVSVSGTGQVEANQQLDIKPQTSGTIVSLPVQQGQTVSQGQTIAVLDQKSALLSLAQAKASLASAQANYQKVIQGLTPQDLQVAQLSVQSAQQSMLSAINSAYLQIDNTMRTSIDQFYINPTSFSPQFSLSTSDSSGNGSISFPIPDSGQLLRLSAERKEATAILTSWNTAIDAVDASNATSVLALARSSIQNVSQIKIFFDDIASAINSVSATSAKYQSTLNQFKTTIASARSTVESVATSLSSSQQSLLSAQASYAQQVAPPLSSDVASAQAQIDAAQASLQSAQDAYSNTIISAPFSGQIGTLNFANGYTVASSDVIATLITHEQYAQISLNEVDVAKVRLGQKATLTFDALPDLTMSGTVTQIDSIGTVSSGVVTYNVRIAFDVQNASIKPGMSVSASIITTVAQQALIVPSGAIKMTGNTSVVQVLDGVATGTPITGPVSSATPPRTVMVQTGLSNDSDTQITSGLQEGDLVVTRVVSGSAAITTAPSATSARTSGGGLLGGGRFIGR